MNILAILLGWLLGILSPGIINNISNFYRKKALHRIMVSELKDIKKRLVCLPLKIHSAYGNLDVKCFEWAKNETNNFTEIISTDNEKEKI